VFGFGVQGFGYSVWGLMFRILSLRFCVLGGHVLVLRFGVHGLVFVARDLWFMFWCSGFRARGL
jgi:hypothetical protein